jgi:hypothetical protein
MTPERKARVEMDALLAAAGTHGCDMVQANVHPAMDVAIRELPLDGGVGFATLPLPRKLLAPRPVKVSLKCYERTTIASLPNPESFDACASCTIAEIAISLENMRKLGSKLVRTKRPGNIHYVGADGETGSIDAPLFDEELVVEDETFVGQTELFCYYFADPCWVNHHTHLLRARPEVVSAKYLNLAFSHYPFIPLTTRSTGRRKLTKAALMTAPISVLSSKNILKRSMRWNAACLLPEKSRPRSMKTSSARRRGGSNL